MSENEYHSKTVMLPRRQYEFRETDKPFYVGYREYRRRNLKFAKCHSDVEIGFQAKGRGQFYLEDRFFPMVPGQAYIVDPSMPHGHETVGDEVCGVLVVHIPTGSVVHLSPVAGDLQPLQLFFLAGRGSPLIVDLTSEMQESLFRAHSLYASGKKLLAWAEVVRVIALLVNREFQTESAEKSRERTEPVARVLNSLIRNPERPWTVQELSQIADLSVSRFSHVFRRIMGCSVLRYRNRLRVDKAVELLRGSNLTIEKIGDEVGFNDISTFRSAFRKETGKLPSGFRQETLQNGSGAADV